MLTPTPGSQGLENLDQSKLVKSANGPTLTQADYDALESRVSALERSIMPNGIMPKGMAHGETATK